MLLIFVCENETFQCATFVGTVTYMSPERIRNDNYSYPADIWSLGLALFECGTGEFPYTANEGPVNLMLQVNWCIDAILFTYVFVHIYFSHMCRHMWEVCRFEAFLFNASFCHLATKLLVLYARSWMIHRHHQPNTNFHQNSAHLSIFASRRIPMLGQQQSR